MQPLKRILEVQDWTSINFYYVIADLHVVLPVCTAFSSLLHSPPSFLEFPCSGLLLNPTPNLKIPWNGANWHPTYNDGLA